MVLREELFQHECLEEPTRVSEVPLCGAGFRHGLNDEILRFQCFTQLRGETSNTTIPLLQLRFEYGDFLLCSASHSRRTGVGWQWFRNCVHLISSFELKL